MNVISFRNNIIIIDIIDDSSIADSSHLESSQIMMFDEGDAMELDAGRCIYFAPI
jgi:hypothetical protein